MEELPVSTFLPSPPPPLFLSPPVHVFYVTRGLAGDAVRRGCGERVGGTEERGGEVGRRGGRIKTRRYRTLTCFGLISGCRFVLKPLALIWGPQHLELIITQYSSSAPHSVRRILHPTQCKLYTAYVLEFTVAEDSLLLYNESG